MSSYYRRILLEPFLRDDGVLSWDDTHLVKFMWGKAQWEPLPPLAPLFQWIYGTNKKRFHLTSWLTRTSNPLSVGLSNLTIWGTIDFPEASLEQSSRNYSTRSCSYKAQTGQFKSKESHNHLRSWSQAVMERQQTFWLDLGLLRVEPAEPTKGSFDGYWGYWRTEPLAVQDS